MQFKKLSLKFICFLLVFTMIATFTYTNFYQQPKYNVHAIAIADDAIIFFLILAAVGCTYYGTQVALKEPVSNSDDLQNWINDWMDDSADARERIKKEFDDAVKQKAYEDGLIDENGEPTGNYNPNDYNDDDPNNIDPTDPDFFEKLKNAVKNNGNKLKATAGGFLAGALGIFGAKIHEKAKKGEYLPDELQEVDGFEIPQKILDKNLKYYAYCRQPRSATNLTTFRYVAVLSNNPIQLIKTSKYPDLVWGNTYNAYEYMFELGSKQEYINNHLLSDNVSCHLSDMILITSNCPVFNSQKEYEDYYDDPNNDNKICLFPGILNPNTVPFTSTTQKYFEDNDNATSVPVANEVHAPNEEDLINFINGIIANNGNSDGTQNVVNNYITTITTPTEEETPTPTATPTATPQPTATGTATPAPTATATPQLTETIAPDNTHTPDENSLSDNTKEKLKLPESIKEKFPFCIPFDMIDCIRGLESNRAAPSITWNFDMEKYNLHWKVDIDLSQYDKVAELCRLLIMLLFIVGLAGSTRGLIRG